MTKYNKAQTRGKITRWQIRWPPGQLVRWSPGRSDVTSYFKFHIQENAIGYSYEQIFRLHLGRNVNDTKVEDPYIRPSNPVGFEIVFVLLKSEIN